MLVAVGSTILSLAASVFAAYAIERVRFTGARPVGLLIFLAYLVPPSILFIPLAFIVFKFGIYDSKLALIFTYPTFLIPFCTWLLMGYFRSIPFDWKKARWWTEPRAGRFWSRSSCRSPWPGLISAASSPSRSRGTSSSTR